VDGGGCSGFQLFATQIMYVTANKRMLKVEGVSLSFGGLHVLKRINFEIKRPEIVAIIGPNGAGKTCLLNCISGFYHPNQGDIHFMEKKITGLPTHAITRLGVARTFQNIELCTGLTVLENVMAARHIHMKRGALAGAIYFGPTYREEMQHRREAEKIVDFLEMQPLRKKLVGFLPYGMRKRLELGRALALEPKLLLLDEPMAGMNTDEKEDMVRFIFDTIELRRIPIILVEHDMEVVMDIADRVVVLDFGQKIAEGTPEEIKVNPQVIKAYLGEG